MTHALHPTMNSGLSRENPKSDPLRSLGSSTELTDLMRRLKLILSDRGRDTTVPHDWVAPTADNLRRTHVS